MNQSSFQAATAEAKRFLKACRDYQNRLDRDPVAAGCKEGGALRRASLDLTRALAELRRP